MDAKEALLLAYLVGGVAGISWALIRIELLLRKYGKQKVSRVFRAGRILDKPNLLSAAIVAITMTVFWPVFVYGTYLNVKKTEEEYGGG